MGSVDAGSYANPDEKGKPMFKLPAYGNWRWG